MSRSQRMETLQEFVSVLRTVRNHFAQERHAVCRKICKRRRAAAEVGGYSWPKARPGLGPVRQSREKLASD